MKDRGYEQGVNGERYLALYRLAPTSGFNPSQNHHLDGNVFLCDCVIVFAITTDVADTMPSLGRLDSLIGVIDNIMIDYYV
jgi:hypothetical protein